MMYEEWLVLGLALMLTYLVHSTVVLVFALGIARMVSYRYEQFIERLWRVALFAPVLTATLQCSGRWPGTLPIELWTNTTNAARAAVELRVVDLMLDTGLDGRLTAGVLFWGLLMYASVVVVLLVRLFTARRMLSALLSDRKPVQNVELLAHARRLAGDSSLRISVSGCIASPLTVGRREVCLPFRALQELSDDEMDAVLAHEIAHLVRRDNGWLWATRILERMLWVQPLNWMAASRLHALAEFGCDRVAVQNRAKPEALASALATVTSWIVRARYQQVAVAMASSESLSVARVRRVLATRDNSSVHAGPMVTLVLVVMVVALTATVVPGVAAASARQYTILASDPAGEFALTFKRGSVARVSLAGTRVDLTDIETVGNRVVVRGSTPAHSLDVVVTPTGGITWSPRSFSSNTP